MKARAAVPAGAGDVPLAMALPVALAAALAVALVAAAAGCASAPDPDRPPIAATTVGPALTALWKAGGGLKAWKRFSSVRFTYEAEIFRAGGGATRPDDPGAVEHVGPVEVAFSPGDWSRLWFGPAGKEEVLRLREDPPRPEAADYALRSIRVLFAFPFNLADPVWEFHCDVLAAEPVDLRRGFRVVPTGGQSPHRAYLVEWDREGDLARERLFSLYNVDAVYYQVDHPRFAGQVWKAVFGRYQVVEGLRLPTEITHTPLARRARPAGFYPWEPGGGGQPRGPGGGLGDPTGDPDPQLVFRERITAIRLLEAPAGTGSSEAPPAPRAEGGKDSP